MLEYVGAKRGEIEMSKRLISSFDVSPASLRSHICFLERLKVLPNGKASAAVVRIQESGGRIELDETLPGEERITVEIPSGAIAPGKEIALQMRPGKVMAFDIVPSQSDTEIAGPIMVTVEGRFNLAADPTSPAMLLRQVQGNDWEEVGGTTVLHYDDGTMRVTGVISDHLSRYAFGHR